MSINLKNAIYKPFLKRAMERMGHGLALEYKVTRLGGGEAEMSFDYKPEVIGNPLTGVVHGGVIVSLMDTCCGTAAFSLFNGIPMAPTMDLRLDYMRSAEPHKPIYVSAKVYRNSSSVIFCRGVAWQDDRENPIAHCVANFMKLENSKVSYTGILKRQLKSLLKRKTISEAGNESGK